MGLIQAAYLAARIDRVAAQRQVPGTADPSRQHRSARSTSEVNGAVRDQLDGGDRADAT